MADQTDIRILPTVISPAPKKHWLDELWAKVGGMVLLGAGCSLGWWLRGLMS